MFLLVLFPLVLIQTTSAFSFPTINTPSSGSFLSGIFNVNSSDTPIYAALFALAIIIIIYQVLQRTMLSGGAAGISMVFGAILFVLLFTQPQLIQVFLDIAVGTIIMALLTVALLIPNRHGTSTSKIIGLIILVVLLYLVISNNSGIANSLNNVMGLNVKGVLPVVVIAVIIIGIIWFLIRIFRQTKSHGLKAFIPIIILGLLLFFFVPGAGAFLLSPYVLAFYALLIFLILYFAIHHRSSGDTYGSGKSDKEDGATSGSSKAPLPPPNPTHLEKPALEPTKSGKTGGDEKNK